MGLLSRAGKAAKEFLADKMSRQYVNDLGGGVKSTTHIFPAERYYEGISLSGPKTVTWGIEASLPEAGRQNRRTLRQAMRGLPPEQFTPKDDALQRAIWGLEESAAKKKAVAAFKAAERNVLEDMKKRPWWEPWSPESGYQFYGSPGQPAVTRAGKSHNSRDAIYAKMLARNKHPDYYVQTDGHNVFLRRKLPIRHELAAAAAAGVVWPSATSELPLEAPLPDPRGLRGSPFDDGLTDPRYVYPRRGR